MYLEKLGHCLCIVKKARAVGVKVRWALLYNTALMKKYHKFLLIK